MRDCEESSQFSVLSSQFVELSFRLLVSVSSPTSPVEMREIISSYSFRRRLTGTARLGEFQAFEFDAVGADLGEIVVGLLGEPGCGASAEYFR